MRTTTPSLLQQMSVPEGSSSPLKPQGPVAPSYHAQCHQQHRWSSYANSAIESINGVLAPRFATTLLLVGIPTLVLLKLA